MLVAKDNRPSWFKIFLHQKSVIDSVPNENVGAALKAALHYFETGENPQIDPLSSVVFSTFKQYIDESFSDFQAISEKNRQNVQKRWANQKVPNDTNCASGNRWIPKCTKNTEAEAEAEAEADAEADAESIGADKPPTRPRFCPPSVDDVKSYCTEKGYKVDPQRFVDYYESNGWMVGRNKMKDWKAAVRSWASKEQERPTKPVYESSVDRLSRMYREEFGA